MLFTHRGLCGPGDPADQLLLARGRGDHRGHGAGRGRLAPAEGGQGARTAKQAVHTALGHIVPRRLAESDLRARGRRRASWPRSGTRRCARLDEAVNAWTVKPVGSEGYRTAEVTLGGVATDQLDQQTMAGEGRPGPVSSSARSSTSPAGWAAIISSGPGRRAGPPGRPADRPERGPGGPPSVSAPRAAARPGRGIRSRHGWCADRTKRRSQ